MRRGYYRKPIIRQCFYRGRVNNKCFTSRIRVGLFSVSVMSICLLCSLLIIDKTISLEAYISPGFYSISTIEDAERVALPLEMEVISSESKNMMHVEETVNLSGSPQILIYHTHTTEAYAQDVSSPYTESGSWRTTDNEKNVVAVGERLAELLKERGYRVIHDTTNNEPPKLATSYSRSETLMRNYQEKYPGLQVFIDIHRDAYGNQDTPVTDFVEMDGEEVARMMFVVGTGKGATGTGFSEMPYYESNYALATAITERLLQVHEKLIRPIRVKSGRYNQHISDQCMLIEVGHTCNTLKQALAAVPYLAEAIDLTLKEIDNVQMETTFSESIDIWSPKR